MKEKADNEKLLIRYLLGDLSEEKRLQVEDIFLIDDQNFERLLVLENELFYDYAQGKLSTGDRERFKNRYLSSVGNQRKSIIASALADKISEAPLKPAESGSEAREPQIL